MLKNGHAGLLDTDYINNGEALNTQLTLRGNGNNADYLTAPNTYRGSGNDITKQKVSELEDYIKAGFPVVFSDGFSAMIASIKVELMRITLITVQMFLPFKICKR